MLLLLLSHFSCVRLCATPQTASHQAPLSLGFSRQEHWSGLPFPSPRMKVKSESEVAQSCPTLSDVMDCSPPGSSIYGILQARVLEWITISFSRRGLQLALKCLYSQKPACQCGMNIHCCCLLINSCPTLCDPMDYIACQALPSMGFFRQEYWSGLPSPFPGDLPDPRIGPRSPASQADLYREPPGKPYESLQLLNLTT